MSTTLAIMSFGFARGVPRNADLVFDMRFLRNPHWEDELRPLTGLDGRSATISPATRPMRRPWRGSRRCCSPCSRATGPKEKSYVSVAFGCTGGRHRSVHVAERVAARLREAGFSPTVDHRDLATPPVTVESDPQGAVDGQTACRVNR